VTDDRHGSIMPVFAAAQSTSTYPGSMRGAGLFAVPVVGAPMAGGPTTAALAAAVSEAGGLGFLAGGYKTATAVSDEIAAVRAATSRPFGLNLFFPVRAAVDEEAIERYARSLEPEEERYGIRCGEPVWSDDGWEPKLALVARERPAVASFTFGCPDREIVAGLRGLEISVWATVTSVEEAQQASVAGVSALVVQGAEAGGHQGAYVDRGDEPLPLLTLLQKVRRATDLPLVAAGGIAGAEGLAAVLAAGAVAGQIGTALMRSPEAGTSEPHRQALRGTGPTRLTRAFSGRRARGIVNRFMTEHHAEAPVAYPQVHFLTAPLRARARELNDPGGINLWAGENYRLAEEAPAGELVEHWAFDLTRAPWSTSRAQ
jgi:nitronate monooxygenase